MKLGPFFSAFGNMARRLDEAGADALVLFNRFYQPDFDVERREVVPSLELSTPEELRLPLLWISVLFGRLKANIAATTGVETPLEVIKYLMAGADVVMTTSSLLRHGASHLATLRAGLEDWLDSARIPVGRDASWLDEPWSRHRSRGVRAGELHQRAR